MPSPADRVSREEKWTLWPCTHGGVLIEPGHCPQNYGCVTCGAKPILAVSNRPVPEELLALLSAAASVRQEPDWEGVAREPGWDPRQLRCALHRLSLFVTSTRDTEDDLRALIELMQGRARQALSGKWPSQVYEVRPFERAAGEGERE